MNKFVEEKVKEIIEPGMQKFNRPEDAINRVWGNT